MSFSSADDPLLSPRVTSGTDESVAGRSSVNPVGDSGERGLGDELAHRDRQRSALRVLFDWVVVIAVALGAAIFVRMYVLQQFYISGPSMETTLFGNDRVLVNKLAYRFGDLKHGDVVVFDRVTTNGGVIEHDDLIKRVMALGTETIEIKNCTVFVNDQPVDEPYLDSIDTSRSNLAERCRVVNMPKMTVPADNVFVMGDNRPESFDSRSFGVIPENLILGKAFAVVWPLNRIGGL